MKTFEISSEIAKREIIKRAENIEDVIQYVENHLDLSLNWLVKESRIQL